MVGGSLMARVPEPAVKKLGIQKGDFVKIIKIEKI